MTRRITAPVEESTREPGATARLAAIVEWSTDAMIGKTLDGTITSWNSGAERMHGYAADEIIGRSISVIIPAERPDELCAMLQRVVRGQRVDHFETERVRKDGTVFAASVSISPIRDTDGTIIGASTVARDITDRKRAEADIRDLQQRLNRSERLAHRLLVSSSGEAKARETRDLNAVVADMERLGTAVNERVTSDSGAAPRIGSDLGPRELEVLQLMAIGMPNKGLAGQLRVSLNTVRNYVQSVLHKLGAHSKLEAVATAVREGIIEREPARRPPEI